MGLLDSLFGSSDGSGGLLDLLRQNAMQQQFSSGLPSDQAQYALPQSAQNFNAPSPLDNAKWPYGPVGAPAPASAQASVPQQPPATIMAPPTQAPAPSGPGMGDRFMAGLQGFAHSGGLLPAIANGIEGLATGQRSDPAGIAQQAQNTTARALIAKGVDPVTVQAAIGNPTLMEALIKQHYGPHNIQSIGEGYVYDPQSNKVVRAYTPDKQPLSLGSGYIYKDGKVLRAYEPEDKTPVGFEKTDNGMRPIPGGPADPAYLRSKAAGETDPNAIKVLGKGGELYKLGPDGQPVIVHKNEEGGEATLDDKTTKAMAAQYLAGDRTVMQNLGRGAQGAANIVKLRTEIYKQSSDAGLNSKDIVDNFNEQAGALAGQRAVGTRAANISLAANEANNMIPIAIAASDKVPRSQWMPWNKMVQAYQTGASSPELASFVAATNSLVNSYVRAVSPSGVPTDSMREHAYSMLNSAQGPEAFKAVVNTMKLEMKAALEAPSQVKKELRGKTESEEPSKIKTIDGYKIMEH